MRRMGEHFAERPIARCLLAVVVFLVLSGCNLGTALQPSPTPTAEATKPVTRTPAVESVTISPTPTLTATPRPETPTATPTTEPAVTPTAAATATMDAAFAFTATPTSAPTPLSLTPSPSPSSTTEITCAVLPEGPFLGIWQSDPTRQLALGCPTSHHPRMMPVAWEVATSYQPFENGVMVWSSKIGWYEQPAIYVLYATGEFDWYHDAYEPGDPGPEATPPAGLLAPALGFGKLWEEHPDIQAALGWATAPETPGSGRFQLFIGGNMIWLSQRGETYVLVNGVTPTYVIETTPAFAD